MFHLVLRQTRKGDREVSFFISMMLYSVPGLYSSPQGKLHGAFRKPHRFDEHDNVRYYEICSNQVEGSYVYESNH